MAMFACTTQPLCDGRAMDTVRVTLDVSGSASVVRFDSQRFSRRLWRSTAAVAPCMPASLPGCYRTL